MTPRGRKTYPEGALRVGRKQCRQTVAQIAVGNGHELSPVEP